MKRLTVSVGMVCLLMAGIVIGFGGIYAAPEAPVASVNGVDVTTAELKAMMAQERTAVIQAFQLQYGAEYGEAFWVTEYEGVTPLHSLKQKALSAIVRDNVQQAEALRRGMVASTSYEQFLKLWKQENERRKLALQNNEVIYGPVENAQQT